MRIHRDHAVAFLWGFAEATLFFIVPDVWLTLMSLRGIRKALVGCVYAASGALMGGVVMYLWGRSAPSTALSAMDAIPAISRGLIHRVMDELSSTGIIALFVGPFSGAPYKLYAVVSGALEIPLILFILISIPARLVRFILLSTMAGVLSRRVHTETREKAPVILLLWGLFYAIFFALMPD